MTSFTSKFGYILLYLGFVSALVLLRALGGYPLNVKYAALYSLLYILPICISQLLLKKYLIEGITVRGIFWRTIGLMIPVSFLISIGWVFLVLSSTQRAEAGMIVLFIPIIWGIIFVYSTIVAVLSLGFF